MADNATAGALRAIPVQSAVDAVFSKDGTSIYVGAGQKLYQYSIADGALQRSWGLQYQSGKLDISSDGKYVDVVSASTNSISGGPVIYHLNTEDGSLKGYDLAGISSVNHQAPYPGRISDIFSLSSGNMLIFGDGNIYNLNTANSSLFPLQNPQGFFGYSQLSASADHSKIVSVVYSAGVAYLYSTDTNTVQQIPGNYPTTSQFIAISPQKDMIARYYGSGISILGSNLSVVRNLGSEYPFAANYQGESLAFSADSKKLFVYDVNSSAVYAISVADGSVVGSAHVDPVAFSPIQRRL